MRNIETKNKIDKNTINAILARIEKGESYGQVAKQLQIPKQRIRRICVKNGIKSSWKWQRQRRTFWDKLWGM